MSTLLEELNKNKAIEDAVQPNKMSKFAYTEKAYEDNDASGVDSFDFEADQNIPSDKLSVLQTNETVILKGFRAQASSVTRQLLNHFFGRASYNLNKVHDVVKGVLDAFVNFIGKANGIATLDENGRIPYSQLPESAMEFKGTWDASTNTPTLADGTGDTGDFYVVSVAGTQDLGSGEIKFLENDRVIYSDAVWSKLSGGDVRTVNNIQPTDGNVTLTGDDINFSDSDTTKVSAKVTSHINATTGVHGAVSTATANKIAIRDASGRLQVATPSAANDAANKSYVDSKSTGDAGAVQTNLTNHINNQASGVHGATPEATAGKLIIRDSSGRAKVANPSAVTDIANKQYVDNKTWNANDITAGTLPIARGGTGATTASGVLTNLGVTATAAELNKLDGFTGSAAKLNFTNNVTSDIQSQINSKAPKSHASTDTTYGAGTQTTYGHMKVIDDPNPITHPAGTTGIAVSPMGVINLMKNLPQCWVAIDNTTFGTSDINSIAYGKEMFVAVGDSGKIAFSRNSINWAPALDTKFGSVSINSITSNGYKFVAVGNGGKGASSSDGLNWESINLNMGSTNMSCIINTGDVFVAGGNSPTIIFVNQPESTWSKVGSELDNISGLAYGNSRIVAVGRHGNSGCSTSSRTHSPSSGFPGLVYLPIDRPTGIAYGKEKFVVVGEGGDLAYSYNGINWTEVYLNVHFTRFVSIYYDGKKFNIGGNNGFYAYSYDGINWTILDTRINNDYSTFGFASNNIITVGVGAHGQGSYSYNI